MTDNMPAESVHSHDVLRRVQGHGIRCRGASVATQPQRAPWFGTGRDVLMATLSEPALAKAHSCRISLSSNFARRV
jgi:hypothetical protein